MTVINLTPHVINVGTIAIPPSGAIARVTSTTKVVDVITVEGVEVDVVETVFGEVQGLPEYREGVYIVVSALVRIASGRPDLLSPGEQTRDKEGRVTGCKNLTR